MADREAGERLAKVLRVAMAQAGIETWTMLGIRAGVSPTTVDNWIYGRTQPRAHHLAKVALVLRPYTSAGALERAHQGLPPEEAPIHEQLRDLIATLRVLAPRGRRTLVLFGVAAALVLSYAFLDMTMARRLLMVAGGGGAFAPQVAFALTTAPDGGWTQASDPHAVYGGGKTFVPYIDMTSGDAEILSYDHSTGASATFTLRAALDVDTHACPAVILRPDGRLVVAYSAHNGAEMYVRVSTNTYDVSAWGAEQTLDATLGGRVYTYSNLHYLNGDLYLFYRDRPVDSGNSAMAYGVSTNDGDGSWSAQTILYQNGTGTQAYWEIDSDGSRMDFAVIDDRTATPAASIYHFSWDGTTPRTSDGTAIGAALPLEPADLTLVYNGGDGLGWAFDIIAGTNPAFVYAVVDSGTTNSWRHARWNGAAWDLNTIASSGGFIDTDGEGNVFAAGVAIDHVSPSVVFANVKIGSRWEVQRFVSDDNFATSAMTSITSGSSVDNLYVATVRDHPATKLAAVWLAGTYTTFEDADFGISGY